METPERAMGNAFSKLAMIAAGVGAASVASADGAYRGYEAPSYEVTERLTDSVEIRTYAPYIVAEVSVRGDRDRALRQGFSILAGYIFGGNSGSQSVEMTSPVTQTQSQTVAMTAPVTQTGEEGVWTITFMMPRAYTLDTLPTPNNAAIRFYQTESERLIVETFSGWATESALAEHEANLRAVAASAAAELTGPAIHRYYDDPMTLPWQRRNEIAFRLR
jgi:hypothetical protein